ncbi:MAG: adenylosuccinate synthetase, partial [Coriobacteriaceae bacterium]|nr:adenylosuccinate synthetase [Coriobacteriaceae bacterium]
MPSTVLVGAQWGDEGKGKITDLISSDYDYVVRYQGGNNAGHTVIHGDTKLALHLMPSGVLYDSCVPVIGNGVVVDPSVLVQEMEMLHAGGISTERLAISCDAHVIMPYHIDLDG